MGIKEKRNLNQSKNLTLYIIITIFILIMLSSCKSNNTVQGQLSNTNNTQQETKSQQECPIPKELESSPPRFIEDKEYCHSRGLTEWNCSLLYPVGVANGDKYEEFILQNGKEMTKHYGGIYSRVVNNKLVFVVSEDRNKGPSYVVYDNKEGKRYQYIKDINQLGDGIIYTAYNHNDEGLDDFFVVIGDKEVKRYDNSNINFLEIVENKPYYDLTNFGDGGQTSYVYGDQISEKPLPLEKNIEKRYGEIIRDEVIGGKRIYVINKKGKEFVLYGGIESEHFDEIAHDGPIYIMDGKPVYIAENGEGDNYYIVHGKDILFKSDKYYITDFVIIQGKPAILIMDKATRKNKILYDNIETKEYDEIFKIINVRGKLVYIAKGNNGEFVVFDGVEQKHYKYISRIQPAEVIANRLVFIASNSDYSVYDKNYCEFVVHEPFE